MNLSRRIKFGVAVVFSCVYFNAAAEQIKLNQIAYRPSADKVAVVPATIPTTKASNFSLIDISTGKAVFTGALSQPQYWQYSGENVQQADFSKFTTVGEYQIRVEGGGQSYPFKICDKALLDVHKAAIKAYYFNRSGMAIDAKYGGDHARAAGHLDMKIKVHKSAASKERKAGTFISSPKGWYDAGDYGKYIVNSGISTYTLLAAYEHHQDFYQSLELGIPESDNGVPDILDEVKWNLDWMETMQDADGGVYHKLTALKFSPEDRTPAKDTQQRYVIGKSVTAALDFTAVMAVASRVFKELDSDASKRYGNAAIRAYHWAQENPTALYKQPKGVGTGAYGDKSAIDEFAWAEAELFVLTGDARYFKAFNARNISASQNLTWSNVGALGFVSLINAKQNMLSTEQAEFVRQEIIDAADQHLKVFTDSAYGVAISEPDFVWGSNGDVLNNGIVLIQAYRVTGDKKYHRAAMSTLNYVLGQNATGYSFVTGHGDKTPMFIHHRPSIADKSDIPVPGFLAGGPHSGKQDRCKYSSDLPATTYSDTVCSYSTNEVAINWNAPLVYMLAAANAD